MSKKLQIPKLVNFKRYKDKRGYLIPFETSKNNLKKNIISFKIKRVFFSVGKKNYFRGDHSHKKCKQLLVCLNGKINIQTIDLKGIKKIFNLSKNKNKALFLPPFVWNRIYFKNKESILAVICDYKYDNKKEYINKFKSFKKLIKK